MINTGAEAKNTLVNQLLWFTLKHLLATNQCRKVSQGVEASWMDPDFETNHSSW
jgi:hypothetical protein